MTRSCRRSLRVWWGTGRCKVNGRRLYGVLVNREEWLCVVSLMLVCSAARVVDAGRDGKMDRAMAGESSGAGLVSSSVEWKAWTDVEWPRRPKRLSPDLRPWRRVHCGGF